MTADSVFNAYLDANIILAFAACLWAATRFLLNRSALRQAFTVKLQLVYGVLGAVALTPVVIIAFNLARQAGLIGEGYSPSLSDYALAQFLNGRFDMAPSQFETLWMARTVFAQNVTSLGSVTGALVAAVIGMGALLCTGALIRNALRVRRLIRGSYLLRRMGGIDIRMTDRAAIPFSTRGLRRRYIVVPSALLSQADDLRITVSHELQHMRQGDLGAEILLEVLRPLFFWNPGFAFFKREVEELRELACDQQVLMRARFGVQEYCDCLLRVCHDTLRRGRAAREVFVPSVPLISPSGGKRAGEVLKRRFVSMLGARHLRHGRLVLFVVMVPLVCTIGFVSIASQSSGDWSQDRLMLSTIVNLERLDQKTIAIRY